MKKLVIIGAGGFGREIFDYATNCIGYQTEFVIKGFIDNLLVELAHPENYPPILGCIDDYEIQQNDVFICALGDVKFKKKYCEYIMSKGGTFTTLISNRAYISKINTHIGKGCIICPDARIHVDVTIGDFVTVQPFAVLGHDVKVGNWSHVNALADCGGASVIGEGVTLHTTSFVLPKSVIENYATVGAGSVVLKRVNAGLTVFGVPAKPILVSKKE